MQAEFNISTYVNDHPDPGELKRRPPRTAKLVVALSWSWSPAHHRSAVYWICSNIHRSDWILWEQSADWETGKPRFQEVAIGSPRKGLSAKDAAIQLVTAAWKAEW